jgi:hypothetical protein
MTAHTSPRRGLAISYAVTVFLSAFLLFQVQPLIGKFILPWFGGSPAVWTTCMLVFQVLLFAGYAYAHFTTEYLKPRHQIALHMLLLLAAIVTLPIAPDASWKPTNSDTPALRIMLLMMVCVGLPYFILSATGPLVQSWFSRTHVGRSPYRLYSLSNIGSLLALVTYPLLFEPNFSVYSQSAIWSVAFALFAGLCAFSGWQMRKASHAAHAQTVTSIASGNQTPLTQRPNWGLIGLWFLFALTPSLLLLASTNQVCMDVAVIPFLWVLPLALYLVSFILCFDSNRWYTRRPYLILTVVLQVASVYMATQGSGVPILLQVALYFGALFCCCMTCHGELSALKPHPRYLTLYFLTISAGGAAGGIFVGLLAPILFVTYSELQFGILCFIVSFLCLRAREDRLPFPLPNWTRPIAVACVLLIAVLALAQASRNPKNSIVASRNFYGMLKVEKIHKPAESIAPMLELAHGRIAHGSQFIAPSMRQIPTAYYANNTGIGQLMLSDSTQPQRRVGIVGLGVGTLAAYGRAGDYFRMYEINPDVISIARQHFTFLSDSLAEQAIVSGDARLSLEFESPQNFDILVLDAFSGDAIPVHLLTREALEVYLKHLRSHGVLACHISNLHFNLRPVIAGLANDLGLTYRFIGNSADVNTAARPAVWALLARLPESLAKLDNTSSSVPTGQPVGQHIGRPITWTDARSNLLEVIW